MKNIKQQYKKSKEIIDALNEEDKKALKKSKYICYDDVIEFPSPCAFSISHLKQIVKDAETFHKKKGKGMLIGMTIVIPIPKELQKKFKLKDKKVVITTKKFEKKNNGMV